MKISNVSSIPQQVGIVLADGRVGTTRIMARVRMVQLPNGSVVDPRWEAVNPGVITKVAEVGDIVLAKPVYNNEPVKKEAAQLPAAPVNNVD